MNREFEVHLLNDRGKERAQAIAEAFSRLLTVLVGVPPGEDPRRFGWLETMGVPLAEILKLKEAGSQGLPGLCPAGRELSIVRTKLEEACFFAKKAMASLPENQETK